MDWLCCYILLITILFVIRILVLTVNFFFFKQKTAYEMRISDWSSDVCSSDLFSLTSDRNRGNCGAARNADDGTGDDSGSARYACCGLNCVIVVLRLGRDSAALEPGYVSASGKGGARVEGLAGDGEKHLFLFGRIVRYRYVANSEARRGGKEWVGQV